jgi:hypothetical protein
MRAFVPRTANEALQRVTDRALEEALSVSPRVQGVLAGTTPDMPYRPSPRRTLLCRLGLHRWQSYALVLFHVIDMGRRMKRCDRCGKEKRA